MHVLLNESEMPECRQLLPDLKAMLSGLAQASAEKPHRVGMARLRHGVSGALQLLGLRVKEDVFLADAGDYHVDMLLDLRTLVEVQGPKEAVEGADSVPLFMGDVLLKRRQLEAFGYSIVSIPHWVWEGLDTVEAQMEYLKGLNLLPLAKGARADPEPLPGTSPNEPEE